MCGRFVQVASPELLVERFGVDEVAAPRQAPSYNVAPRATVYAVRERVEGDERRRVLSALRWGLVPSWSKDVRSGDRMINARAETLTDKPAYERAFRMHRCLIPAEGFYEWQRRGGGTGTRRRKLHGRSRWTPWSRRVRNGRCATSSTISARTTDGSRGTSISHLTAKRSSSAKNLL